MTKQELRQKLLAGVSLQELFSFSMCEECEIYKARTFSMGAEIVYIPSLWLNGLPKNRRAALEEIPTILDCCYTGEDFAFLTRNNFSRAERLFQYCSWQHPFSALCETLSI